MNVFVLFMLFFMASFSAMVVFQSSIPVVIAAAIFIMLLMCVRDTKPASRISERQPVCEPAGPATSEIANSMRVRLRREKEETHRKTTIISLKKDNSISLKKDNSQQSGYRLMDL